MLSKYYLRLIYGGLIWGAVFFLSRNLFLGVGFLMLCFSLAGFFAAYIGLLYAPWNTPWVIKLVKVLKPVTLLGVCIVAVSFVIVQIQIWRVAKDKPAEDTQCLVVLGAGVYGTRPSASLRSRMDKALEYMNANSHVKAILSGGQGPGEDISEAEAMRRYLTEKGISEDRLILEGASTNTVENLTFSFEIAEKQGFSNITIVTNEFHQFRSQRLAGQMGYQVGGLAAPVPKQGLFPLSCFVREYCSILLMYVRELIS